MCLFKVPEIKIPDTPIPAPLPPELDSAKTVESIDFGGGAKLETETASGIKGEKSTGKSSLKIKTNKPKATSNRSSTGANFNLY